MDTAQTRVLHVITGLDLGGAEVTLLRLIDATEQGAYEHAVLALGRDGPIGSELRRLAVPVLALEIGTWSGSLKAPITARAYVARFRPNVIQGWMYHGNVAAYALRSSYSSGCRLFWNVRQCLYDIRMEKPMTRTVIRVGARVSSAAHGIIYNSGISLAQHTQLGFSGDRALVIPNGFDTSRYRPDPERRASARLTLGIAPDEFVIGTVGRYHPVKDHKTLLSACAILVERGIKARFVIVGPGCGPDNAVLTDLASGLDLGSRVIRRDQWDDTSTLFQAFDAFCLTSVSEGFPNVLAEAMSCGVACVATNVGECALLLDRCGILVEASAPEEVARALTQLATMSEAQRSALGQSGRARICSDFKLSTAVRRYESLYASGCAAVT